MLLKFSLIILLFLSLYSCNTSEKKQEENIQENPPAEETSKSDNSQQESKGLQILFPAEGEVVSSPLKIEGKAKGTWFFEAVFGVKLLDQDYNLLRESYVSATEDWMTEDWVPFNGSLKFTEPKSAKGFLVFEKANPSGLEEHMLRDTLQVSFRN